MISQAAHRHTMYQRLVYLFLRLSFLFFLFLDLYTYFVYHVHFFIATKPNCRRFIQLYYVIDDVWNRGAYPCFAKISPFKDTRKFIVCKPNEIVNVLFGRVGVGRNVIGTGLRRSPLRTFPTDMILQLYLLSHVLPLFSYIFVYYKDWPKHHHSIYSCVWASRKIVDHVITICFCVIYYK